MTDGTLEAQLDWVPGMSNIRLKDLPSFMRITNLDDILFDFFGSESRSCFESGAPIIFNTFDELEHEVLDVIGTISSAPIYTIGPLHLLSKQVLQSFGSSLWSEDYDCIKWLDKKPKNSVVYVNYGSMATMSEQHLLEFAWGLANSKHSFLWILRSDVVFGSEGSVSATLPEEFYD